MDWIINVLVPAICAILGAFGGVSIFTIRQERKLKDIEVTHNQADEWKRLYEEADVERKEKDAKLDKMREERDIARSESAQKDLKIQHLCWYHCTVENCKSRRPPHVYDVNGTEIVQQKN